MSVLPEVVIHNVIVRGLREIRKDPRVLDALFKQLDQQSLEAVKQLLLEKTINFSINFPRVEELKLPTIALVMKTERESESFLNDLAGASPHYGMPDQELAIDTLGGHAASTTDLQGLPRKIIDGLSPQRLEIDEVNDVTTLFWQESQQEDVADALSQFAAIPCLKVYVSSGTGGGQVHTILRISSESLDIEGTFDPQLDSSSVVDIRLASDTGPEIGEPSRVYPADATTLYRRGANFNVQYQLSVIAGHQNEVLYLYAVLKSLLFSQKMFMEKHGIFALKISGSDFAPRREFLPSEAFERTMTLEFIYPFTFLQEAEDVFNQIQISLAPTDPVTGESCHEESVLISFESETTI